MTKRGLTPLERVLLRVEYVPSLVLGTNCWIWQGAKTKDGYGHIGVEGKTVMCHRVTYGDVPDGLELDHLCRVRDCCNPDHLEAVTPKVNRARGLRGPRTVCKNGHEYTEENTYTYRGVRHCRECRRIRNRR